MAVVINGHKCFFVTVTAQNDVVEVVKATMGSYAFFVAEFEKECGKIIVGQGVVLGIKTVDADRELFKKLKRA